MAVPLMESMTLKESPLNRFLFPLFSTQLTLKQKHLTKNKMM